MSKRVFSSEIICSDAFLGMSTSAQALYVQLNMAADGDGVVNAPKKILRSLGLDENCFEELKKRRFILELKSGIIVIKHWRVHNTLRKDRYRPSKYQDELKALYIKPDGAYTRNRKHGKSLADIWQPSGSQNPPNVCPNLNSISISNSISNSSSSLLQERLTDDEYEKLSSMVDEKDFLDLIDRLVEIDADSVSKPFQYCLKVAKEMGVLKGGRYA